MYQPNLRYLEPVDLIGMHQEIMISYSQTSDLRDKGYAALEGACMRPQQAAYYEHADLAKQAALLIIGIAQAHPFVDGNKRIALAAGTVFVDLNGYMVQTARGEFGRQITAALTNEGSQEQIVEIFAEWIRSRLNPLSC